MRTHGMTPRWVALILVVALVVTLAVPERTHADAGVALAIAGAAVAVLIIVAYLVVANVHEARQGGPVLLACVEGDGQSPTCWPIRDPGELIELRAHTVAESP